MKEKQRHEAGGGESPHGQGWRGGVFYSRRRFWTSPLSPPTGGQDKADLVRLLQLCRGEVCSGSYFFGLNSCK